MFRAATAVRRIDAPSDGSIDESHACWGGRVEEGWDIAGNANGGYLLAIAGRAMSLATGRPDPVTVTGHYLSPGKPGDAVVDTTVVRSGRRLATVSGLLSVDGRPVLSALGTFGDLDADKASDTSPPSPELVVGGPPELPTPDDCLALEPGDLFPPPFMGKVEMRLHPDDARFLDKKPTGDPRIRGWFRLRDDEPVTTLALLCAVDAFPPTIFNADLPIAWTPTVELTAHVRAVPAPGWLACRFSTRFVTAGFLEADGEIWDTTGQLVAQSRQLALVSPGLTAATSLGSESARRCRRAAVRAGSRRRRRCGATRGTSPSVRRVRRPVQPDRRPNGCS